jgi:tetratricopeptide (TPR) repeat protein
MSAIPNSNTDIAAIIDTCADELARNAPAESVYSRLRDVEHLVPASSPLRPKFLQVRAIAANRLGFPRDALGDLQEARQLLEPAACWQTLGEIERTVALVQAWRGNGREAALALLRAMALATTSEDRVGIALSLMGAARLEIEIGRPHDAELFFARAFKVDDDALPDLERVKGSINRLQALVAAGRIDQARAQIDGVRSAASGASHRLRLLVELEAARVAIAQGNHDAARAVLNGCRVSRSDASDGFEATERKHVEAELAMAVGLAGQADALLRTVIARYAADDLAGREVVARLLHARALDALNRSEESDRTLAAALRRAVDRGLSGYTDRVRSLMTERGGSYSAWTPSQPPSAGGEVDVAQRFVRRRAIGLGASGSVMRAYDLELGTEVALKRIALAGIVDLAVRARLLDGARREIMATSRIEHPAVARVFGLLVDRDGDVFVIQELIEGPTLRAAAKDGCDAARAADILAHIAYGLAAVHAAGVVHRDLKPDNIILRDDTAPVLVDFGIALIGTDSAGRGGTRAYMAPEQVLGGGVDARADLYALGVIACELFGAAIPPSPASDIWALVAELWRRRARHKRLLAQGIAPDVADLIARLVAEHRYWRPRSAAEAGSRFAAVAHKPARHRDVP